MKNMSNATEKNPRPNLVGSPKILSQSSKVKKKQYDVNKRNAEINIVEC